MEIVSNSRHQLPLITLPSLPCPRVTLASSCAGTGDYTISVQRGGKCAYALSQCTQQGEAHPIYLVTCSFFWVVGGKWFSQARATETDAQAKRFPQLDSEEPRVEG